MSNAERTTPQRISVCLTMIVRDAADFIAETLASVLPYVDHWVIVDTGSVDRTAEVVTEFFAQAGVPGTLMHRPWVGFSHNRTEALTLAAGTADYALMLDADDLVVGHVPLDQIDHNVDLYLLQFGPDFIFWRPALFRLDRRWEYRGAVHEYAVAVDGDARSEKLHGRYHLVFQSLGARGKDPLKFRRDVAALLASWDQSPDDARTAFYLGQSYRDAGDDAAALDWYLRRVSMPGWNEETFVAALEVGRCLHRCGNEDAELIVAYCRAADIRPSRAEPWLEVARLHRTRGRWREGYDAAVRGAEIPFPFEDILFVAADIYRWQLADERSICAHFLGLHEESVELCEALLVSAHLPDDQRERILANRDQSLVHLMAERVRFRPERVQALASASISPSGEPSVTLTITTCCRRELFERTIDSFLECCSDHNRIRRWICIDDGSSADDRAAMLERYPFFEFIFESDDDRGHASSMGELLRQVDTPYWLHLEDDWDFVSRGPFIEQAIAVLDDDATLLQVVLNRNYAETLEHRNLVGGELRRTRADFFPYRRHGHLPVGSDELEQLLAEHPGRSTNAHWPGFSLMPSMIRTASIREVGAFDGASGHFELDFAMRARAQGWRTAFLDSIVCVTTGKLRNDLDPAAPPNAYELNGLTQFQQYEDITIGLLPNWTSGNELARQWGRQMPPNGSWRGVRFVMSDDATPEPDYWVVVNHAPPDLNPPPERTIVLQMEPAVGIAHFGPPSDADRSRYLHVRSHDTFLNALEWHLAATYSELLTTSITKKRDLSVVVSSKRMSPGHHLRLDLVHAIEAAGLPIDVYGTDNGEGFLGYLGPLPPLDKREGLFPYRYTIAAENHSETNYLTEKLVDAILAETLCFYWGCPNLEDHVDAEAFIRLPMEDPVESIDIVRRAIDENEHARRLPAIRRAKRRILDQQQVAAMLSRLARGARVVESLDVHVINLDRRPDRLAGFHQRITAAAGERFATRCERYEAFDGNDLQRTDDIAHMFRGSELPLRRAQTACAISHMSLWWRVATGDGRPALVFEDDAVPQVGFVDRLVEIVGDLLDGDGLPDVLFLGLSHHADHLAPTSLHQREIAVDLAGVMGGAFAYVVSQAGARGLWELAQRGGIPCAIDTFILMHTRTLRIRQAVPALVTTPVARNGGPVIESDIQYDRHVL